MVLRLKINFFLLMILLALSSGASAVAADEKQLIVGWGDSLTEGLYSLTEGFCTHGYNEVLQTQMADVGRPSTQVNCGIGGEKSTDSLRRLKGTLLCDGTAYAKGYCTDKTQKYIWGACNGNLWSRKDWYTSLNGQRPDFILIWIGANDEIHRISYSTTIFNVREMIRVSREYEITPLIATLTPDGKYGEYFCDEHIIGGLNYELKGLARDEKVSLADECAAIPYWTDNDCGDELHPNEKGNQTIARTWLRVLPEQSDYYEPVKVPIPILNGQLLLLLGK